LGDAVRTNFDLDDYETAYFAAMKAVEVAVCDASGLDNSVVGVKLMRRRSGLMRTARLAARWLTLKLRAGSRRLPL
jgi:hypothetical protein